MADQVATRAAGSQEAGKQGFPGALPAAAIAVLSGIGVWTMLMSGQLASTADLGGTNVSSDLAQVDDSERSAAVATLNGSDRFLAQFKEQQGRCPVPLAWVSVIRPAGQAGGTIRLRSGNYFSPVFDLGELPVRIAIPYPAPYEEGRGTLTALVDGGAAVIALQPPWHPLPSGPSASHQVTWPIVQRCKPANG